VTGFTAQHRDRAAATHQARVVGDDLQAATVLGLDHIAGLSDNLGCEQWRVAIRAWSDQTFCSYWHFLNAAR
jgi:hypothetical protein